MSQNQHIMLLQATLPPPIANRIVMVVVVVRSSSQELRVCWARRSLGESTFRMMTTLTSIFLYANVCCEALDRLREIVRSIERGVQPHVTLTGSLRNALLRYFGNIFLLIMIMMKLKLLLQHFSSLYEKNLLSSKRAFQVWLQ